MKKFVKENWFVVLIAVFFIGISIFFAYDQHKDDLPGKKVGGKDVAYSVDDQNVTMDDFYNGLYKAYGKDLIVQKFTDAVLDNAVKTTDELKQEAQSYTDYYTQMYAQYGGLSYLNQVAAQYGYPDFTTYMLYSIKSRNLSNDYIAEHLNEYATADFINEYNPRTVSYCLIKFEDPANPTADELARLQKAQEAWASDKYTEANFNEFAIAFSEDASTASNGGKLGYLDAKTTDLVEEFTKAAVELKSGEVSEWVKSDHYGYFLIKCDSTNVEDFKDDSSFVSRILEANANAANEIVWAAAQKAGVKFEDKEIEKYILQELGIGSED